MLLDGMKRIETSCWRVNVTVWRSADECFLKRCWSGLETSAGMIWQWHVWKCVETMSFNYKCKLVLHLRLGYLKPFLAGSKKTRQGPGWRVGSLCISRCWFYLTVVVIPKQIQKITKLYGVVFFCVMVLDDSNAYDMWMMKWKMFMNDYEIGRIMEWWIGS